MFPQPEQSSGNKGSAPRLWPSQGSLRHSRARSSGRTWVESWLKSLAQRPCTGGQRAPLGRERGRSLPQCPSAAAPSCGRTWSDLARAPAAAHSPQRPSGSSVPARTRILIQTHTLPERSARDLQSLAHALPPVPHTAPTQLRYRIPCSNRPLHGATYLSRQRRCGVRSSGGLGCLWPPRAAALAAAAGAQTEPAGQKCCSVGRGGRCIRAEAVSSRGPAREPQQRAAGD